MSASRSESTDLKYRKYVTVPSRFTATAGVVAPPRVAAPRKKPPLPIQKQKNSSCSVTNSSSSLRHSSPKVGRNSDAKQLSINDSVASAVLPIDASDVNGRCSLSVESLPSGSSDVTKAPRKRFTEQETDKALDAASILAAWTYLERYLTELTAIQNERHIGRIKRLLLECEDQCKQLCALTREETQWKKCLSATEALQTENSVLKSLIRLLGPVSNEHSEGNSEVHSTDMKPLPTDIVQQLNRLYTEFVDPAFNRLPLRGFIFGEDEPLSTDNIRQFIGASERTAELVEDLADVVERTADCLESTTVPLAHEHIQRLSSVCQLFVHEASLRFLQLQQSWLREFVSDL